MKYNSLRIKHPFIIFICITILLTVFGVITYSTIIKNSINLKKESLEISVQDLRERIINKLYFASDLVLLGAKLSYLADNLDLPPKWEPTQERLEVEVYLNHIKSSYDIFDTLLLVNSDGYILAGDSRIRENEINVKDTDWFKDAINKNTLNIGKPAKINDVLLLPISLRIYNNLNSGLFIAFVRLDYLFINSLANVLHPTGMSTFLIDNKKELICSVNNTILNENLIDTDFNYIYSNIDGSILNAGKNKNNIVAFSHIPQTSIYVLGLIKNDYLDSYNNNIKNLFLIQNIIVIIIIQLVVFILLYPSVKDILKINKFSKKVITGKYTYIENIDVTRQDEIGELAKNVEDMTLLLDKAAKDALANTEAKSTFLAKMSHEIRTPMNGIIGMASIALMDKNLSEQQTHYLKNIEFSANSLLGIINDILDLSKIEANKLELKTEEESLIKVISPLSDIFASRLKEKPLEFKINFDKNLPKKLYFDPIRINQICLNLCNNAIKFTENGYVHLNIIVKDKVKMEDGDYINLLFEIKDSGIGIPKDAQDKLFQNFAQVDNAYTRKIEGTGLGLSICKSLVELMNGKIGVKSVLGEGSTFYFTISLKISENNDDQVDNVPKKDSLKSNIEQNKIPTLNILLVEDNMINKEIATAILKKLGMNVTTAQNGLEAVNIWKTSSDIHIIFMDIQMPVMNGYTATAEIRETLTGKNVPIIAMTANALSGDKEQSIKFGMNDHITKPININELIGVLSFWSKKIYHGEN